MHECTSRTTASDRLSRARGPGLTLALRMALRGLVRSPGTSLLAVTILVLGLAAPVTFFSLLVGALRPLPVPEGKRVVRVEVTQPRTGGGAVPVTLGDLDLLRDAASLEGLGAFRVVEGTLVDPARAATRVSAAGLTPEVLPLLRTSPIMGRVPTPGDGERGILLGYHLWEEAYDRDPGALGRAVVLNGRPGVIAGVLPEGFGFPFKQNAWFLLDADPADQSAVELVGRLADGASVETASVELAGRWIRSDELRLPGEQAAHLEVDTFTGGRGERGEGVAFIGLVLIALALLLIAGSNVANLLLVRASDRVRTLGIQSALGAGRLQLAAQIFFEALLLAMVGGTGGLLLAGVGVEIIQRALAAEHFGYFWMRMAVDGRVVLFASFLVCGTAVFAGTLPVLRVLGLELQGILKQGRGGSAMKGTGAWGRRFVTAQLALSCAALVAAGLTGESLARSRSFGRGVPAEEILVASLDPGVGPEDGAQELGQGWGGRVTALEVGLASVPGARATALALGAPGYLEPWGPVEVEGSGEVREEDRARVSWNAVSEGFFSLLGLDIHRGRGLADADREGTLPVAVVNESFVTRFLPDGDAVGRRLRIPGAHESLFFTVVGVVEDVDMGGGPGIPTARVYLPLRQVRPQGLVSLLRSGADPRSLVPGLREAVASVDPRIPLWSVRTLSDAHAYLIRVPRAMASMALAGGLGGLVVAGVGLFGLLSFRVRQRRRELGIRLAVGADGRRLAMEVLRLALEQLLPALGMGLALAWIVAPALGVFLLGLDPRSPITYLGVSAAFLAVGIAAALIPARRAAGVEPAEVLRGE